MANKPIVWDPLVLRHFSSAIDFIAKDSIANADRIRIEILDKIDNRVSYPKCILPIAAAFIRKMKYPIR